MPRPSNCVSPSKWGGGIRSASQNLHLSLAEVKGKKYSTRLISQIERNPIDASEESLKYLAERLKLPFDNLMLLAQQYRGTGIEESKIKSLDEKRALVSRLLNENRPRWALEQLQDLNMSQLPPFLRWRLFALHGQCYFSLRKFQLAQPDFLSAVAILPEVVPHDHHLESIS